MEFSEFGFVPRLLDGLEAMGYRKPTPIQEQAIPMILEGSDLIACAQTGTGKTAAYILPLLHRITQSSHSHLNTLVIAPTRELAQQIDQQIDGFSYFLDASSIPVYGGGDGIAWEQQKEALRRGADIVIATPGRLISLIGGGDIDFSHLEHLVLDEADRMLDMGFYEDIIKIIRKLPASRQTLLFSATMPPRIRQLASQILRTPKEVSIEVSKPATGIDQQIYMVNDEQKIPLVTRLLGNEEYQSVIIFASTKENAKKLDVSLRKAGFDTRAFHSDLEQHEREQLMRNFKSRKLRILVGTDVLSRGIDVDGVSLVLNYDVPPDPEDYIHRIGRTARAEKLGTAITLVNHHDSRKYQRIEKMLEKVLPKAVLPDDLGPAPDFSQSPPRSASNGRGKPNFRRRKTH